VSTGFFRPPSIKREDWVWDDEKGWTMTPEAAARFAPFAAGKDNQNNFKFNHGQEGWAAYNPGALQPKENFQQQWGDHDSGITYGPVDEKAYAAHKEQVKNSDPMGFYKNFIMKDGKKTAKYWEYKDGEPVEAGQVGWDTNKHHRSRNVAFGIMAALAAAGAAAGGMFGGGGAGGAEAMGSGAAPGEAAGTLNGSAIPKGGGMGWQDFAQQGMQGMQQGQQNKPDWYAQYQQQVQQEEQRKQLAKAMQPKGWWNPDGK
jgi:hypothetical protein